MATQPGFIFGGDTDWTYEQLQNKRRIAEALAAQIGSPRTVGQGLSAVGKALAARGLNKRADKREGELREDLNAKWAPIEAALAGGFGTPAMSTMGGGVRAPAPVTTRTEADVIGDDVMTALGRDPGFEDWNARIRRVETGGEADPWAARGPVVERGMYAGEQAIGPNQIMPGNIAEWGAMAGIDPQWQNADALAAAIAEGNPEARAAYDAIVLDQYNRMAEKGYTPEQKASVWFTGSPTPNPNVSDGFTSASEYVSRFGGGAPSGGGQPTMSARNGQSFDIATLAEVAGSPLASPGQRAVAQALLQQQLSGLEPVKGITMGDRLVNPMTGEVMADFSGAPGSEDDFATQSSEILANGTTVVVGRDGRMRVMTADGTVLEGQAAIDAVEEAQRMEAEYQRGIYAGRTTGTNQAEAETGAAAAAAGAAGEQAIDLSGDAWASVGRIASSNSNITTAIDALDNGARAGAIDRFIPNITEASASLRNAMDRLGLDVIAGTTFGALSEAELRLAMETAVPRNLDEPELRAWLVKKKEANEKTMAMLQDAAIFLGTPGNTLAMWIEKNKAAGVPAEEIAPKATHRFNPATGKIEAVQ